MTYDLVEYNGKRKVRTLLYNKTYQLCRGMLKRTLTDRHSPGTYFKIEKNHE